MSKKNKIILFGILILILIVGTLFFTYAYFQATINNNKSDKSAVVKAGKLELTYFDDNDLLSIEHLKPGTVVGEKTFSVKNTGTGDVDLYKIILQDVVNELNYPDDLTYTLTCESTIGTCNGTNGTFPTNDTIIVTNSIEKSAIQTYKLTVTYNETYQDQSEDMNKIVRAKVNIKNEENERVLIYGNTLASGDSVGEKTKNLFGGEAFADKIVEEVSGAVKDSVNKTITYHAKYICDKILFSDFKPNTQYTIINKSQVSGYTNLQIKYTDGKYGAVSDSSSITVSKSGKTIASLSGIWYSGTTVIGYNGFGVFEGVLSENDFEPYGYKIPVSVSKLPSEYQEVEYISNADANSYLIPYTTSSNTNTLEVRTKIKQTVSNTEQCLLSSSTNTLELGISSTLDRVFQWDIKDQSNEIVSSIPLMNKYTKIYGKWTTSDRLLTIDNNQTSAAPSTLDIKNMKLNLLRYTNPSNKQGSYPFESKLYYFKIYDNGIKVRDLIPCYRKSDGIIGMYDTVEGGFYTNQGTDAFEKGPDKNTYNIYLDEPLRKKDDAVDYIDLLNKKVVRNVEVLSNGTLKALDTPVIEDIDVPIDENLIQGLSVNTTVGPSKIVIE